MRLLNGSLQCGIIYRRSLLHGTRTSNIYQCNQQYFQRIETNHLSAPFSTAPSRTIEPDQPDSSTPATQQRKKPRFNPHDAERQEFRRISKENRQLIQDILPATTRHPPDGFPTELKDIPPLQKQDCPGFTNVKIKVVNMDTIDAAIRLTENDSTTSDASNSASKVPQNEEYGHPCILNISNGSRRAGLWAHGARTQEEAICRRSTLRESLRDEFYPLPQYGAVYSPSVVVFRQSVVNRHHLMNLQTPEDLPVISVITMAPVQRPAVIKKHDAQTGKGLKEVYQNPEDRDTMKEKMRLILRISAIKGNRRIVLGAFGCGAFKNPKGEVADCWAEVFGEPEFQGGWWKDVVFAIWDPPRFVGDSFSAWNERRTAPTFVRKLDGLKI